MTQLHNALHRAIALQRAFAAALGEQSGDFSGIERAGETLTPTLDLWGLPEWSYLRGEEKRAAQTTAAAGGAGTFSEVRIVNPAGSGLLVVVELIRPSQNVNLAGSDLTIAALTDVSGFFPRDGRLKKPGSIVRLEAGAPALAMSGTFFLTSNLVQSVPWILSPGRQLRIQNPTANTALFCSIALRLRPGSHGELE